jgi:hypothetical protein
MSHAITQKPMAPLPPPGQPALRTKPQGAWAWIRNYLLMPIASLRLTVTLLGLSIFLVFAGTLAQVDGGVWTIVERYFRTLVAWIPFQAFVRLGQVFFGVSQDLEIPGSFPYPGGFLLGGILLINLLAAHALRFRFTWKDLVLLPAFALGAMVLWFFEENPSLLLLALGALPVALSLAGLVLFHGKRGGVILLHLGLVIMMLSELVTYFGAVEATMTIAEGETASFVDLSRRNELAIIDRTNPKMDDVVVIPEQLLRQRGLIRSELLPFDVVVERYLVNASLGAPRENENNLATAGDGLQFVAHAQREVSGTDTNQVREAAAAYVTLKKKGTGQPLGTYLVSLMFDPNFTSRVFDRPQQLTVDGRKYEIYLRPERVYKSYQLRLIEFRHDKYLGTNVPRNFSSLVHLNDSGRGEERDVKISMNQPLRHAGETLYQSQVLGGQKGTVLQVVRNPGWLMPYISCVMVALGMLLHFGYHLIDFLSRRVWA